MTDYRLKFRLLLVGVLLSGMVAAQTKLTFPNTNEKSNSKQAVKTKKNSGYYFKNGLDSGTLYFSKMGNKMALTAYELIDSARVSVTDVEQFEMDVLFEPKQNMLHKGLVLIEDQFSVRDIYELEGQGTFSNVYYANTRNKSEEDLKTALKSIVTNGYKSLGYTRARDEMYASIDNKNGEIECVYTGTKARFNTRSGANSAGFNCEHTYPQGFFSKNEPMRSDIHHLFPTTVTSNSRRGNDPFGVVSSTSWQQGGSKSGGGKFEPRDTHKGAVARAMMYFVLRHKDYDANGTPFLQQQESTLRQWHTLNAPTTDEKDRNQAIYAVQNNRNPFVDYPQFIDRITKVSGNSVAPKVKAIQLSRSLKDIILTDDTLGESFRVKGIVYNSGTEDVTIKSVQIKGKGSLDLFNGGNQVLTPNNYMVIEYGNVDIDAGVFFFDDTLLIETDVPGKEKLSFVIKAPINTGSGFEEYNVPKLSVFPNPVSDQLRFEGFKVNGEKVNYDIFSTLGLKVKSGFYLESLDVSELESGNYMVHFYSNHKMVYKARFIKK